MKKIVLSTESLKKCIYYGCNKFAENFGFYGNSSSRHS